MHRVESPIHSFDFRPQKHTSFNHWNVVYRPYIVLQLWYKYNFSVWFWRPTFCICNFRLCRTMFPIVSQMQRKSVSPTIHPVRCITGDVYTMPLDRCAIDRRSSEVRARRPWHGRHRETPRLDRRRVSQTTSDTRGRDDFPNAASKTQPFSR